MPYIMCFLVIGELYGVKTNIKTQLLGYLHLLNKEAFGNLLGVIITAIICTYKKPKQSNCTNNTVFLRNSSKSSIHRSQIFHANL